MQIDQNEACTMSKIRGEQAKSTNGYVNIYICNNSGFKLCFYVHMFTAYTYTAFNTRMNSV